MDKATILGRLEIIDKKLCGKALEVKEAAAAKLSRIVETFPEYTSHDSKHKEKVLEICEWLAGPDIINRLNAPELFVLCSAVFLHDVGMVLGQGEKTALEDSPDFQRFAKSYGTSRSEALAEWVRRCHHKRSGEIIRNTYEAATGVGIRDKGLAHATALICESHGENDLEDFEKYDPFYAYGTSGTRICLPLLGVFLRLSDILHFTEDRTPLAVLPLVGLTGERSKMEWYKHLSTVGVAPGPERTVRMTCICTDPSVHRDILHLCDRINQEFEYARRILARLDAAGVPKYDLPYTRIVPKVTASGYEPWLDLTFTLDREGIIKLLTGSRIYHGPAAALKELLMNAVDASRQAMAAGMGPGRIRVEFSSTDKRLSICDGGVGMDREDLEQFLLKRGRCIYQSEIYPQRYGASQRIDALSEFGIGFASCFLVSDHVVLETKRDGKQAYLLDLYDLLGFAAAKTSTRETAGTTVTLHLKEQVVKDMYAAVKGVPDTCPHVEIPIEVTADGEPVPVLMQDYCPADNEMLVPFFRSKGSDLLVEHRHFEPESEDVAGCVRLLCQKKGDIVLPGYKDWFKLSRCDRRRVSQLGFRLPGPDVWPNSLLGKVSITQLMFDVDLRHSMRLEMDPSRTTILPSPHNAGVIARLDDHIYTAS